MEISKEILKSVAIVLSTPVSAGFFRGLFKGNAAVPCLEKGAGAG